MILHPRGSTLEKYADGELAAGDAGEVAAHLVACERCRAAVEVVRALGEAARSTPTPEFGAGAWTRVADRRAAGDRVILPVENAHVAAKSTRWLRNAAAAAIVAAASLVALPFVRGVSASQAGRLAIRPAHPLPGSTVTVKYTASAALAGDATINLRGRWIPELHSEWHYYTDPRRPTGIVLVTLERSPDGGSYGSTIQLPDSAVYALFSLESGSGEQLDTDDGRLFDLVIGNANGRPGFHGLVARARRASSPNHARALAAADSLVAIYPDSAQSWAMRWGVEGASRIQNLLRVFSGREKRYATLDKALSARANVSAPEMYAMAELADRIEDSTGREAWIGRLFAEHPTDPAAAYVLAERSFRATPAEARGELVKMEAAWSASKGTDPTIAEAGLDLAVRAADSAAITQWALRSFALENPAYLWRARELAHDPAIRPMIQRTLRLRFRALKRDSTGDRSLLSTRFRGQQFRNGLMAHTLAALGWTLELDGAYGAAADTVVAAVVLTNGLCGFDALYRQHAGIALKMGDTAGAARDLAHAATAPGPIGHALADSAPLLLGAHYSAVEWKVLLENAGGQRAPCTFDWAKN